MKKKLLAGLATGLFLFGMAGMAEASLTNIGYAVLYDDTGIPLACNMIYDDDSTLGPITWLDYSHVGDTWQIQRDWAASLNNPGELQYFFLNGITTDWAGEGWRLPSAGSNPTYGYNQTTSEMGHLYITELGLESTYTAYTTDAELNAGEFSNLIPSWYWSGTESAGAPDHTWIFDMLDGYQSYDTRDFNNYALAVQSGRVSAVPAPGAIWLLGSGMAGSAAMRRRKKKQ
ncbi:MAG: VPLPA-CTERM sorting domain-containing protein [Desulfobulbaceae bacterium]|nr:VPLPA-CTERM sorting domain-containing protein [Desulfobulbaceae bacterium]